MSQKSHATVDGSLSGTVLDDKGISVPNAKVTITGNGIEKDAVSSATGTFQFFPLTIGNYQVNVQADGFNPYQGDGRRLGNKFIPGNSIIAGGGNANDRQGKTPSSDLRSR